MKIYLGIGHISFKLVNNGIIFIGNIKVFTPESF